MASHYYYDGFTSGFEDTCEGYPDSCDSFTTEDSCTRQSGCRWE
jgi:hypothetical protein